MQTIAVEALYSGHQLGANILSRVRCPLLRDFLYIVHLWSIWVSAVQGLLKYWCECKDSQDFQNCPFIVGVYCLGVSVKWGFTVATVILIYAILAIILIYAILAIILCTVWKICHK